MQRQSVLAASRKGRCALMIPFNFRKQTSSLALSFISMGKGGFWRESESFIVISKSSQNFELQSLLSDPASFVSSAPLPSCHRTTLAQIRGT